MTRCLLSETHFAINTKGEANPCCRYTVPEYDTNILEIKGMTASDIFNHSRLTQIRDNLKNGIKDPGCFHCWNEENTHITSMRITANKWIEEAISSGKQDAITGDPYNDLDSIELAFSNHCNMKCRHCDSGSSSKWREDDEKLGRWVTPKMLQQPNLSNLELHKFKNLRSIKILGGEPLLSKEHTTFIKNITETGSIQDIDINIVTNGSVFPNDIIIEGWRQAKSVEIVVSLDDVEDEFNYFRTDGDFQTVKNNMKRLEELGFPNLSFVIHTVVNVLNVHRMDYILDYFVENFPMWQAHLDKIHQPEYLSIDQWGSNDMKDSIARLKNMFFMRPSSNNARNKEYIYNLNRVYGMITTLPNEKSDFTDLFEINDKLDSFRGTLLDETHPIFKDHR